MAEIEQFPYFEVQFTKDGAISDPKEVQRAVDRLAAAKVTDLCAFSHGWNNDMDEARQLYRAFFKSARQVIDSGNIPKLKGRKFAVLGILWPSKKFADEDLIASGAASLAEGVSDEAVKEQIDVLTEALDSAEARKKTKEIKRLVADLENDPEKQDLFVQQVRKLLPRPAADEEVPSQFFALSGSEIFEKLKVPLGMPPPVGDGGGAAGVEDSPSGDAAGLGSLLGGIKAAASQVLNYATYYVMKERAGTVGSIGVANVIGQILAKSPKLKVHLIGHSFGGRVVTAAAQALGDEDATKPATMSLLQAAFSHNGFATKFDGKRDGFFRKVITGKKVTGPIIVTHTVNDKAVGLAYPIASKLSGVDASAIGDENDRFGGLGRNGALVKFTPEAIPGKLLKSGSAYSFGSSKLLNLEATAFIQNHGDVAGKEAAAAMLSAVATT
jgi:hypothetical protein